MSNFSFNQFRGSYLLLFSCLLVEMGEVQAADAAWKAATGGDWNTDANWTAPHPDAIDAIAGFVGFPTSLATVTSTSNITVGSLVLNTSTNLNINLGHSLIFSRNFGNAQIFVAGALLHTISSLTPIVLASDLDVFINSDVNLSIQSPISGAGALSLYGSSNLTSTDKLLLSGNNSYTGGTFIPTGILEIDGASNTTVIPGNISVFSLGSIQHFHDNHYSPTTEMSIHGGFVDLNGTIQSMNKITVTENGIFTDSSGNGALDLLALPADSALTIGNNAQVNPALINLINGGGIFYDASRSGTAFIPGTTTIDLQGHSVDFHVPHNFFNCIDADIGETTFQNGTLNKTGNGVVLFQGGTVPTFNIEDGTVIIGDQLGAEVVTATGPVTVSSPGTLVGFQTLDAQIGAINSGTIRPGDPCNGCSAVGSLTIQGNYAQTASGTLSIKALNSSTSDNLIVNAGTVTLNGELNFDSLPGAVFNPGDQIVVLDNTNGSTPIAGTFSSFVYNLPPCLQATVVYHPHQVLVQIANCPCPPCPSCSSSSSSCSCPTLPPHPPSYFTGVIKKYKTANKTRYFLKARWKASHSKDVIFYRVYKKKRVIAKVSAKSSLAFKVECSRHCLIKNYKVAAVNSDHLESRPIVLRKSKTER